MSRSNKAVLTLSVCVHVCCCLFASAAVAPRPVAAQSDPASAQVVPSLADPNSLLAPGLPAVTGPAANPPTSAPSSASPPEAAAALQCQARQSAVHAELRKHRHVLSRHQAQRAARALCHEAERARMDPLLVLAVIGVESSFDPKAVSPVGAEGLMQLMPHTAAFLAARANLAWSRKYAFDPAVNIRIGTRYLATLRDAFHGRMDWALTAYNRGPTATHHLLREHHGLPHTVRASYAAPVLRAYENLRDLYGRSPS